MDIATTRLTLDFHSRLTILELGSRVKKLTYERLYVRLYVCLYVLQNWTLVCAPKLACTIVCAPKIVCALICLLVCAPKLVWALVSAPKLLCWKEKKKKKKGSTTPLYPTPRTASSLTWVPQSRLAFSHHCRVSWPWAFGLVAIQFYFK